jgi:hypothetical protein
MSSPKELKEALKTKQREYARTRRAGLSEEERVREQMRSHRCYYRDKGVVPHPYTAIGRRCAIQGYSVGDVMSGAQPI